MTTEEIKKIFSSALEVAIKNGHNVNPATMEQIMFGLSHEPAPEMIYVPIIFSHDFAKAFFGKDWEKHLQSMVITEEPLRYINGFLDSQYR